MLLAREALTSVKVTDTQMLYFSKPFWHFRNIETRFFQSMKSPTKHKQETWSKINKERWWTAAAAFWLVNASWSWSDMNQWHPVDCSSCTFTVPWLLSTQSAFQWVKQWDVPNATGQGQSHTQVAIVETLHGGCGESAQPETKQPAHRSAQKSTSGVTLTLATALQFIDDIITAFSQITFKTSLSKTEWVSIWNSLSTFLLSLSLSLMWLALDNMVLCYRLLLWPINEW